MMGESRPILFEVLEPRIMLSGDSLLSLPAPDVLDDTAQQAVQHAELLEASEQVEQQHSPAVQELRQEIDPVDKLQTDLYQPILILSVGEGGVYKEDQAIDAGMGSVDGFDRIPDGVGLNHIGPVQAGEDLGGLVNDSGTATQDEGKLTAVATVAADAEVVTNSPAIPDEDGDMPILTDGTDSNAEFATSIEIRGPPAQDQPAYGNQIVFVDSALKHDFHLDSADYPGVAVKVLATGQDGIRQISDTLCRFQNLSAIHIVSHGASGRVVLGKAELSPASLENYTAQLQEWALALTVDADILIYGCSVADGGTGIQLLNRIAELTGADVAASTDSTGAAELGGDWVLEQVTGPIEASALEVGDLVRSFTARGIELAKPTLVNIQVGLEHADESLYIDAILDIFEERGWNVTVYVTGEAATEDPGLVKEIHDRGHQIAVYGWQAGENLAKLGYEEQLERIGDAFAAVREAVGIMRPAYIADFRPQGFGQNIDTFRVLEELEVRSNSGFSSGVRAFHSQWDFVGIPISSVGPDCGCEDPSEGVILCDRYMYDAVGVDPAKYLELMTQKFDLSDQTKEPIVTLVHAAVTGADPARLDALGQFLDHVAGKDGEVVLTDAITAMANPYVENLSITGPSEATPGQFINLQLTYEATCYCPTYWFKIYGRYKDATNWQELGSHSDSMPYTGMHTFTETIQVPELSEGKNSDVLHIRAVARAAHGSFQAWPTPDWYEAIDHLQITVTAPKIEDIQISANPTTAEDVTFTAQLTNMTGFEVVKIAWAGDVQAGEGNPSYTVKPARGTHGKDKNITATLTYRNVATGHTGTADPFSKKFDLFFKKTGYDTPRSDSAPNWFVYWSALGIGVRHGVSDVRYDGALPYDGRYFWGTTYVTLGPSSAGDDLLHSGVTIRGIDNFAQTLSHECTHYHHWNSWFNGQNPLDNDRPSPDELPNWYEDVGDDGIPNTGDAHEMDGVFNGAEIYDVTKERTAGNPYADDEEWVTYRATDHVRAPSGVDWANPGQQTDPPEGGHNKVILPLNPAAYFTGNASDSGTDTNSNGQFDLLRVGIELQVTEAGTYLVTAGVRDVRGTLWANKSVALSDGLQVVTLDFDGAAIRTLRNDGRFDLVLAGCYDEETALLDYRESLARTAAYSWRQFEAADIAIGEGIVDSALDTDSDGQFNFLDISVPLNYYTNGPGKLYGWLVDDAGIEVGYAQAEFTATKGGSDTVHLLFDGVTIRQMRRDGAYHLRHLTSELNGQRQDALYEAHVTQPYSWSQFDTTAGAFRSTTQFTNRGIDLDGNGLFDLLRVETSVDIGEQGQYLAAGRLFDAGGEWISDATTEVTLGAGQQTVALDFSGLDIAVHRENGPYELAYLFLYDSTGTLVDSLPDPYVTSAYSYTEFESPTGPDPSVVENDLVRLPESLRVGDEYHVSATIRNLGYGIVDGAVVRLNVDDTSVADNVVSIPRGGQVETHFAWMATAGLHDFAIEIDPDNVLEEIDETNNTVTWQVAAGLPDFRCRAIRTVPELPLPDTPISIIAGIDNLGDDPDTNWLDVSLYADDTLLEARTIDLRDIPYEAPLFTWDVTFTASLPEGTQVLRVVVDEADQITETNELNNEMSILGVFQPLLVASSTDSCVDLDWVNYSTYDAIRVYRNDEVIATLGGDATHYDDDDVPPGLYRYRLGVVIASEEVGSTGEVAMMLGYSESLEFDFELDNGGFSASGAWEWGTPASGPLGAYSGAHCWATRLGGNYDNGAHWILDSPSFLLGDNGGVLTFWHWYQTEGYYDGGNVKISADGGQSFSLLHPEGEYPEGYVAGILGQPAFSGSSTGWELVVFDLSAYSNTEIIVRFDFGSDGSVIDAGWYIDDICVFGAPMAMSVINGRTINEGDVATLNGRFVDPNLLNMHTVVVAWGDGDSDTLVLPVGDRTFSVSHQYVDDEPSGTASDDYVISVTFSDDDDGPETYTTTVTVNNVAPTLSDLSPTPEINEGESVTFSGTISDPGIEDTFTLEIDWGDPLSPNNVETYTFPASPTGSQDFTLTHQYLDDNPGGTPSDDYAINLMITDDDTGRMATGYTVWAGQTITFTKADYADWTLPANQDRITDNMWITRQDHQGVFNIKAETSYTSSWRRGEVPSPANTEWTYGSASDWESLTFENWWVWHGYWPPGMVGQDAVLHLIEEDVYLDIQFLSWTEGGQGGGFSYERATPGEPGEKVWTGPTITFTKDDYADWTDPANQDHLTETTWITRRNTKGIFNFKSELAYGFWTSSSPADTEWAFGSASDRESLAFGPWAALTGGWNEGPTSILGKDLVLHLISDDIYLDIKFTSWTFGGNGGGFSYERSTELISPTVTVNNVAPTAAIEGAPESCPTGTPIDLSCSVTDPGVADTFTYAWAVTKDGSAYASGTSADFSFTPDEPAAYVVNLEVTDDDGGVGTDTAVVTVQDNVAPTVDVGPDVVTTEEGDELVVSGSFIDPDAGDSWFATVDYGDGTGEQPLPLDGQAFELSHVYADDGPYPVTVTVTDSYEESDSGQFTAIVLNVAPTLTLSGVGDVDEGSVYTLNLSSDDPGEDTIGSWEINWGDGAIETVAGNPSSVDHVYADGPNIYLISAQATDEDGTYSTNTVEVTVHNVTPTIILTGPAGVEEGAAYVLTLGAVTDPGEDTVTEYIVHWGDGGTDTYSSGGDVIHVYADGPAYHTIIVDLVDEDGTHPGSTTLDVQVINVAPSLAGATFELEENSPTGTVVGTVSGSDPGDDQLTYSIVGGTGASAFAIDDSSGQITVSDATQLDYETTPLFTLEVQVVDDDGATDAATVTINLLNQASITGTVFVDVNGNGVYEANEPGIDGITIELLDENGVPVLDTQNNLVTAITSDGGFYLFEDLDPGTYLLYEVQPTGVDDGEEILGSLGGTIPANDTMRLTLERIDATDYIFAELGQSVTSGDTATIGFWQNKHGQELTRQGGIALADWLTNNFGNVFGDTFIGGDSADVASFYRDQLFRQKSQKSAGPAKADAQFMAVALATYFTSSNLAGNVASDYGFNVTNTGIGTKVVNVGDNGTAFGVASGSNLTIIQLLLATNDQTDQSDNQSGFARIYDKNGDGKIDETEASLLRLANEVYSAINEQGDI